MLKSIRTSAAVLALGVFAWMLLAAPGQRADAQAPLHIAAIDLDIVPAEIEKFKAALTENGAASVKEPGCREFNIHVLANNPNHIFIYEVYDNEAAAQAHRQTDHFKKYAATTANMVAKREVRVMTPVAMNAKAR
jgi:(4S)-4-hydroxy-5-phosphonooxypentane-2,3-dione isomerase